MMNSQNLQLQLPVQDLSLRGRSFISKPTNKVMVMHHQCPAAAASSSSPAARGLQVPHPSRTRPRALVAVRAAGSSDDASSGGESSSSGGGEAEDDDEKQNYSSDKEGSGRRSSSGGGGLSRDDLERLVGTDDDAKFNGLDLANLIRKKYGRSYDVTLIKKEFMGRNLLAMNVMWKYREQRSFPLSEEEYLLRLDDVANTLKCWGAVAHVRNTLEKLKERPRIGKAVSIFIDMDQTGGRSNEWIYK
ncbi:uncharacterized protein [Miscanthus floridulus]|uniref:uncharacterized protein n=1 Tax=Miscanthus floridulus TaxID=154761 RepID=UPI003457A698